MKPDKILLCCCADYKTIAPDKVQQFLTCARRADIELQLLADLCLESIENPDLFKNLDKTTVVAACYPRAVKSLLASAGTPENIEIINLRLDDINTICAKLGIEASTEACDIADLPTYKSDWKAWYPVIDPQKCTNCGKCIDYCLFGVYSRSNSKVRVTNPTQCKTDCPACARMCPAQAIIFPKHSDMKICGGEIDNQSENPNADAGDDLYARLARRRQAQKKDKLLKD